MAQRQSDHYMDVDGFQGRKVTEEDVPDIVKLLVGCSTTCKNRNALARALSVSPTVVDDLDVKVSMRGLGAREFLDQMLREWISKDTEGRTITKLVQTLKSIELNYVADEIAEKYANPLC